MRFQLVATLAALATLLSPFITAIPLKSTLSSYDDLYQYAVKRWGDSHPVAEVIARHALVLLNSFLDMSVKRTSNSGTTL
jgi:hypothetical protein